jgi:DNA-binding transcriptional LysR family regulator
MNINYELYKVFYLTAKHMSFSKAAQDLFVTQSSVSQSIKSLENQLSISLFFRKGKRISLTPSGSLLFDHLEKAFKEIKQAENLLDSYRSLDIGQLRIGASDTICKHYLLEIFEEFHTLYPNIKLLIDNQPSPKTKEEVAGGELDLGFINHKPDSIDHRFYYIDFYTLQEVFFTSEHYQQLKGQSLSAKMLLEYPLISLKKHTSTRAFIEEIFKMYKLSIEPEVELISIDLIADLVDIGLGIGFADSKVITDHPSNKLFPLVTDFEIPKRQISMISHANAPLSTAAKVFIDLMKRK